jgi:lysophospholipase L1-like esterase
MSRKILFVLLLFSLQGVAAEPLSVVALGDSLTEGDGDDGVGGGYPARLQKLLAASHGDSTVRNLGKSGWTSDDLINTQLEPAVAALRSAPSGHTPVALVWIGSNDLFGLYNWVCDNDYRNDFAACERDGERNFRNNLRQILSTLKDSGAKVYIALLDDQSKRPVMRDPELRSSSFDLISADDVPRISVQTEKYNEIIRRLAEQQGAVTVDFSNTTLFEDPATLAEDGGHPNGVGYDAIAEHWYRAILK